MNNSKPWYVIDLAVETALNPNLDLQALLDEAEQKEIKNAHFWFFNGNQLCDILDQAWLENMSSMGLPVKGVAIFYRKPGYVHPTAHIDQPYTTKGKLGVALNWCVGLDDAEMIWYQVPKESGHYDQIGGQKLLEWPIEILEPMSHRIIGNRCTLVRIDIPHNVKMNSNPRWLFSVRLDANMLSNESWPEQVAFFKPRIME
jgi:hypothetical protein